jgi:hypothetical protein
MEMGWIVRPFECRGRRRDRRSRQLAGNCDRWKNRHDGYGKAPSTGRQRRRCRADAMAHALAAVVGGLHPCALVMRFCAARHSAERESRREQIAGCDGGDHEHQQRAAATCRGTPHNRDSTLGASASSNTSSNSSAPGTTYTSRARHPGGMFSITSLPARSLEVARRPGHVASRRNGRVSVS